jgi:hypothetical protein
MTVATASAPDLRLHASGAPDPLVAASAIDARRESSPSATPSPLHREPVLARGRHSGRSTGPRAAQRASAADAAAGSGGLGDSPTRRPRTGIGRIGPECWTASSILHRAKGTAEERSFPCEEAIRRVMDDRIERGPLCARYPSVTTCFTAWSTVVYAASRTESPGAAWMTSRT